MGTAKGDWFACENGHPVLSGSTVCAECGAQVTDRRVAAPHSAWTDSAFEPSQESGVGRSPQAGTHMRGIVLAATAASLVITGAVGLFVFAAVEGTGGSSPTPSPVVAPLTCAGVGTEMALGTQVEDAPQVSCFTVVEESVVVIDAVSSGGEVLDIEVERADGVFWAAGRGAEGVDPEVAALFLPGAYMVTVTGEGGSAPGSFVLTTEVSDPDDPWGDPDPALPGLDECGSPGAPLMVLSGGVAELASDGTVIFACLRLDGAAFVKVGAETGEGNPADLNLAVHAFDDTGRPVFVRSIDDTFGLDPEMSLDLGVGTYLVEVDDLTDTGVGAYALYAATDPEFFRMGEVSVEHTDLREVDCASGDIPTVGIDDSVVFTTNEPIACLTVPETERLMLKAVSFAGQDLTLEVIGFTADGTPFRFAWVDDDLWATVFEDYDPRLDTILPAGLYVLAVTEFNGETPQDLMIAVDSPER
ncbi:MAG: hypothetical protein JW722_00435 [Demequinaceae bacterium]|nr:hypothetical protein [Demequinaceae bacterium]